MDPRSDAEVVGRVGVTTRSFTALTPVTMASFVYWPACAVPAPVQVIEAPAASVGAGQVTATPRRSRTTMSVSAPLPVLVTR